MTRMGDYCSCDAPILLVRACGRYQAGAWSLMRRMRLP
ncbi:hypothetical protein SAMN04488564_110130 [Lentzea waywayandensis]|uniref:Uncharacterized protein n=1 Tax=Lentzea waywayandensis TaxID=84724 RepID=A0A1I6FA93_9PSEU|nr:hypothetical protein SAMN04488564_110130 [Lentzea waywayandensis]